MQPRFGGDLQLGPHPIGGRDQHGIDETGGLLMAGFLLTLRNSKRPNMRLADLLAGIAVRYGKEDLYLAKL